MRVFRSIRELVSGTRHRPGALASAFLFLVPALSPAGLPLPSTVVQCRMACCQGSAHCCCRGPASVPRQRCSKPEGASVSETALTAACPSDCATLATATRVAADPGLLPSYRGAAHVPDSVRTIDRALSVFERDCARSSPPRAPPLAPMLPA